MNISLDAAFDAACRRHLYCRQRRFFPLLLSAPRRYASHNIRYLRHLRYDEQRISDGGRYPQNRQHDTRFTYFAMPLI